jgi:hypothetical protein
MRTLLSIAIALTIASGGVLGANQQTPVNVTGTLLQANKVSDDLSMILVSEQDIVNGAPESLTVQLYGKSVRDGEKNLKPFSRMKILVWLLRSDGTTVTQHEKPVVVGIGNAGDHTEIMTFTYTPASAAELAGVVVRVDGKLFGALISGGGVADNNQVVICCPQMDGPGYQLLRTRLSDDVPTLSVSDFSGGVTVQLEGQLTRTAEKSPKPLAGMRIQAWLLSTDGTALMLMQEPFHTAIPFREFETDVMGFFFEDAPPKKLAGVAVTVNGKLFVREIKAN